MPQVIRLENATTSLLLKLPTELLDEICRLAVADPPRTITTECEYILGQEVQPAITKVCHVLRQISLPIYYGQNTFHVVAHFYKRPDPFEKNIFFSDVDSRYPSLQWLRTLDPTTRPLVRNITLMIWPWVYQHPSGIVMTSKQLAIFLVAHGVHLSHIRNMDSPFVTRTFRDFKDHMIWAASLSPIMRDLLCFT